MDHPTIVKEGKDSGRGVDRDLVVHSQAPIFHNGADRSTQHMAAGLGGKEEEWPTMARNSPLNLLDLPVDILKAIIREVGS
jgi:hypothetical protein